VELWWREGVNGVSNIAIFSMGESRSESERHLIYWVTASRSFPFHALDFRSWQTFHLSPFTFHFSRCRVAIARGVTSGNEVLKLTFDIGQQAGGAKPKEPGFKPIPAQFLFH
jgi:hypothetical protein